MSLTQQISELNNYQMIRKLGKCECLYDHEVIHGNLYLSRTFLIQVDKGEINLDLVKRASSYWSNKNPLLKAQIFRVGKYERYFVKFSDEELFEKFENVEFITTDQASKWKDVMDREVINQFDMKKDPLWRLKIIKFNQAEDYNYAFIFTSQHTIGDGRNMFTLIIELLNILGALIQDRICKEMTVVEPTEYSVEELVKNKQFVYDMDNLEFDSVNRLPECLGDKLNGQHGKMEFFKLPHDKLKRLISKMKSNGKKCKLTGVIAGLILLSQKNVYKNYGIFLDTKAQLSILASVREKLGIKNSYNGIFSAEINQSLDFDVNFENFWEFVNLQSVDLHELIDRNYDVKMLGKTDEFFEKVLENRYDESSLNSIISNIGVMNNTENDLIKVVEHYVRMPAVYRRITSNIFCAISTINGTLCWAISYNEKYFTKKVIIELIDEINQIVDKLIL